jgi:glycosyltransferase involved in cell wall biosynthesis
MEDMQLNIVGPYRDKSGYGMLARTIVLEFMKRGQPLRLEQLYGIPDSMQAPLTPTDANNIFWAEKSDMKPTHNLVIATPDGFVFRRIPGIPNIGITMFETNRIPKDWANACNLMDLVLVPSKWNKQMFIDSGVTAPIEVMPIGIEHQNFPDKPFVTSEKFKFYSIFEFTHRKDYISLITSYYSAFAGVKDVVLVLKTYFGSTADANKQLVHNTIKGIKNSMLVDHPEIVLIDSILPDAELSQIHKDCDCFVLPTRGEGFGIPIADAMYFGNPVIVTDYSGQKDFCNAENSYLVNYTREPVFGMQWIYAYEGTMLWAKVDSEHLMKQMRTVYENREAAKAVGLLGQQEIKENFTVDKMMLKISENLKKF